LKGGEIVSDTVTTDDYLTVQELMKYLKIGKDKAYELAQRKDFPKFRFGNKYIFSRKLVNEWMEKQAVRGTLPRRMRAI
jgi:excisionase family DNA binding protein